MIDACREGIRLYEKGVNAASWSEGEAARIAAKRVAYIYACSKGENALYSAADAGGQFSFFSRALTQVLTESRGQLTLSMLERGVQSEVRKLTSAQEKPLQQVKILTDLSEDDRDTFVVTRKWAISPAHVERSEWTVTLRDKITLGAGVRALRFSPDGRLLASGGHDAKVTVSHIVANGRADQHFSIKYGRIGLMHSILAVSFSADNRVLVAGGTDYRLKFYELSGVRTWDLTSNLKPHDNVISALAFSSDGQIMVSCSHDMSAIVWSTVDPAHPTKLTTLPGHQDHINAVAFSPNTRIMATGSSDMSIIIWDLADPETPVRVAALKGHPASVRALGFSPDGNTLVTGDTAGKLIVWDLSNLSLPARRGIATTAGAVSILALDFHPRSDLLATGQYDGSVILWDLADPSRPTTSKTLNMHTKRVRAINFAPNGTALATGSRDSTVILWGIEGIR
jgi:WD40 repeat protein